MEIDDVNQNMSDLRLSIAIVTFNPDLVLLEHVLNALVVATSRLSKVVVSLSIIDNSSSRDVGVDLARCLDRAVSLSRVQFKLIITPKNLGYGVANNLVLPLIDTDYHLVLNPDVVLDSSSLFEAISFLESSPAIGMLAPASTNAIGKREHLCKAYPSVAALFLRGFIPAWARHRFTGYLARYERHDLLGKRVVTDVALASGCFMFIRTELFCRLNGFSPQFFMYFEDYDLSIRLREHAQIAYVSAVKIVHSGGRASKKGEGHILMFCKSAYKFFSSHGWKLW